MITPNTWLNLFFLTTTIGINAFVIWRLKSTTEKVSKLMIVTYFYIIGSYCFRILYTILNESFGFSFNLSRDAQYYLSTILILFGSVLGIVLSISEIMSKERKVKFYWFIGLYICIITLGSGVSSLIRDFLWHR